MGCVLSCITNLFSAFTHTSINTAVDEIDKYLEESYKQRGVTMDDGKISLIRGIYNSIYYAGQVLGAVLGPHLPDKYGRKKAYIATTIMMTLSCVIQAGATLTIYPEILIFGRFVGALFAPMNDAVMLLYCQETSTPKMRGVLNSLFTTGYSVMALLGMILGMKGVLGRDLTVLLAVPVPLGLIGCLYLFYLQETPKFLMITKQDKTAAMKSLEFYQGVKEENDQILNGYLSERKEEEEKSSYFDLFTQPHLRKALILGNASLILALPFFSFLLSSTYFMGKIGISDHTSQLASTLIAVLLILAFLKYLAMGGIFGYMLCFGLSLGPISFSIDSELVPLQYRSSTICLVFSINSIFVVITNVAVEPLMETIGSISILFLFVIPCLLAVIYLYFSLPETKDYETHQIVQMIKDGVKHPIVTNQHNTNGLKV
ncbi:unnamed protein product, partial [Mesorhabditis belari]|uniref:Major facilitator superfamily (MFS) profile domain-containing protein n=1 Tax=Mesorhabditis belari TaxID=2138241 RepID=A0AAF3ENV3_9BILA